MEQTLRYIKELPIDEEMPTDTPIISVQGNLLIYAGSRTRWITPQDDNYGFAGWVERNSGELTKLGEGHHFGEWWGLGIQRKYNKKEKTWSLFNVSRWNCEDRPNSVAVSLRGHRILLMDGHLCTTLPSSKKRGFCV